MNSNKIEIKTPDGAADCHEFAAPRQGGARPVILYMDVFGVRPALLAMAERLASSGYHVLVPNLFYRAGAQAPFDPATILIPGPARDRRMDLMRSTNNALAMRDTGAFLDYLAAQPSVIPGSQAGCVGYCMGGRFALLAAGAYPERIAAAASFHGAALATDAPDSPHLLANKMKASIYIGAAGIDPHFPDTEKDLLEAALQAAGVNYQLDVYPGARHGFTMTDLPVYDRDAAERHWEKLTQLLRDARWND